MEAPIDPASQSGAALDSQARDAVRNASFLVLQRGLSVLSAFAFAALVPRLLGPADFGRFALVMATVSWFSLLSSLGSAQLTGRFIPVLLLEGRHAEARRLLGNLLAVRLLSGAAAGAIQLSLLLLWLPDLPSALLVLAASTVALRGVSNVPFAFFLGLNQAARWGAGELVRRSSLLLLVSAGVAWLGVLGAFLGAALAELLVLALGLRWARAHLRPAEVRLETAFVSPYLRYNALFFGSNLLFTVSYRGGEALLRAVNSDYSQVGYFAVAGAAYVVAVHGVWEVLMALLPSFARLRAQGRVEAVGIWTERLLRMLASFGVVVVLGAVLAGEDAIRLILGPAFTPAARLLVPISAAVLCHAFGSVGRLLALALDRPRLAFTAALAQASTLVALGLPLAVGFGALGVALAVAAAAAVHAGVFMWALRRELPLALARPLEVLALGAVPTLLAWSPPDALAGRLLVLVASLAIYAAALRVTRLVTATELRALRAAWRPDTAVPVI